MATKGALAGSAFIGDLPNNQDDFYIVRGWYRAIGLPSANASLGYIYGAKKPENYVSESKQTEVIVGMVIVILAIVLPTAARIIIKLRGAATKIGSDDWVIVIAACLAVTYPCLQIAAVVNYGAGRHIWENTYVDYNAYAYYLGICQVLFYVTVGFIKISITLFVRRLADGASKRWRIFADVFLATLVVYIGMALFWWVFLCSPPRIRWDKWYGGSLDQTGTCGNQLVQIKVLSVMHLVQGVILLSAPIIILWHIRIDTMKKIRLFVIWAVGGVSIIGGLLQQTTNTITNDNFWQYTGILRWTVLDLTLGIMVASLPVLDSAIMGSFNSAKTMLGASGSGSRSRTNNRTNNWTSNDVRVTTTAKPNEYSESIENIIKQEKNDDIELNIVRTDEVHVSYDPLDDRNNAPAQHLRFADEREYYKR
ncbi:hypothetical protein BX600DRAFT_513529 [Xylariales sp. PMI_506]|nr:hypothetical protein BX600DRAFT_513529 [Xylariales sp. PMI_506]